MKKTLITLAILSNVAYADEGMWMPQQLPQVAKELKAAGLKLDPASLTKLTEFPMGAIVSLGGCSASFVSPQGLVATKPCGEMKEAEQPPRLTIAPIGNSVSLVSVAGSSFRPAALSSFATCGSC